MNIADQGFLVAYKDGCYVFPKDSLRILVLKTMTYGKDLPKEADEKWVEYAVDHMMKSIKHGCAQADQESQHKH